MSMNPQLIAILESYGPEGVYNAIAWLQNEFQELVEAIDELEKPLLSSPVPTAQSTLAVPALVEFCLLNEFGLKFSEHATFSLLKQQVINRIQTASSLCANL